MSETVDLTSWTRDELVQRATGLELECNQLERQREIALLEAERLQIRLAKMEARGRYWHERYIRKIEQDMHGEKYSVEYQELNGDDFNRNL